MLNCLKAEFIKQKRLFTYKALWLAPVVCIALAIFLMSGRYLLIAAYNWWYSMILPAAFSMTTAFAVSAEKKHNRHGLFAVSADKERLWLSQLAVHTILLLLLDLVFFAFITAACLFFGIAVPVGRSFAASLVLFLCFAWQIPLCMLIADKTGSFPAVFLSLLFNFGFGIFIAPTRLWYLPFAVPARLMCPILRVMPNGLPVEAGNPLESGSVIAVGMAITAALYLICSAATTLWFRRREL